MKFKKQFLNLHFVMDIAFAFAFVRIIRNERKTNRLIGEDTTPTYAQLRQQVLDTEARLLEARKGR